MISMYSPYQEFHIMAHIGLGLRPLAIAKPESELSQGLVIIIISDCSWVGASANTHNMYCKVG